MKKSNPEFRKIPSLHYFYEISEDGRIIRNVKSKKQIKQVLESHNSDTRYYKIRINVKGKNKTLFVHKLVAECWLGECPEGMEVDHIDRDSTNNHYTNLRYVTRSEQMKNRDYDKMLPQLLINLNKERVSVKLNGLEFDSFRQASKWLEELYDKPWKHYCDQFSRSYDTVGGFKVEYGDGRTTYTPKYPNKPITLRKEKLVKHFDSKKDAIAFICEQTGAKETTVGWKICKNKPYVHGFYVTYGM